MLYSVLYKKRKFLFALFFKKKSVVEQYKYNGRNDIKLLRGANLMLLITVIFILVYCNLRRVARNFNDFKCYAATTDEFA